MPFHDVFVDLDESFFIFSVLLYGYIGPSQEFSYEYALRCQNQFPSRTYPTCSCMPLWRNGLARWTSNSEVVGSNPISGVLWEFLRFMVMSYVDTTSKLDEVAEWLRRWTANPLGSARVGSNPILVVSILLHSVAEETFFKENTTPIKKRQV